MQNTHEGVGRAVSRYQGLSRLSHSLGTYSALPILYLRSRVRVREKGPSAIAPSFIAETLLLYLHTLSVCVQTHY